MKARKKPVIVNAWELPEFDEFYNFRDELPYIIQPDVIRYSREPMSYAVFTLEGKMKGMPGDYLVQGSLDDIWVVRKSIFEDTYEIVEE